MTIANFFRPTRLRTAHCAAALLAVTISMASPCHAQPRDAEPATRAANEAVAKSLPLDDPRDFEDAKRGLIAAIPDAYVRGPGDSAAFSGKPFVFLDNATAPPSVNPSLWRQARLNAIHGLFKVTDRVYQVRGIDLANMTIIEGDTGIILIDTLLTIETARAALDLYFANRPKKPVVAIIYSHSHIDHFGGAGGIVTPDNAGAIQILAPTGFMEHAVSENVLAGAAMGRRSQYMYGVNVPPGPQGFVDNGLGRALSRGTFSLIPPTSLISEHFEQRKIDGVDFIFQLTPGTEAPAEMNIYLPQFRVLDLAENISHTMHNLYTLRGAEIRDGGLWSRYIDEALVKFGAMSDVLIGQHHWPISGGDRLRDFIAKQRDLYKFINDQSLRLANKGLKPGEIAENLQLPPALANEFGLRGYYGSLKHNARAVYQKFLGWYDANPANLDPLPPVDEAQRIIAYMGGADPVLAKAEEDFSRGAYRWVASIASKLVFADPTNIRARELGARAFEQMAYQAESASWRNVYLTGAQELRQGAPTSNGMQTNATAMIKGVSLDLFFDFMGVRLNAARAEGKKIRINWVFSDLKETYVVNLSNSALTHRLGEADPDANATITLTRPTLDALALKQIGIPMAVATGKVSLSGNPFKISELMGLLDEFDAPFAIIEPLKK